MRLIDADALDWERIEHEHGARHEAVVDCEQMVEKAPTIDAVPVVRCKDCKHWQPSEYGVVEQPYCKHLGYKEETGLDIRIGNENDFCSFGERKDDE